MIPESLRKAFLAILGLFGVTGFLYGAGYLMILSRMSFLGLYGGWEIENSRVLEEGGKFYYQLFFAPFTLSVFTLPPLLLAALPLAGLLMDSSQWLPKRFHMGLQDLLKKIRRKRPWIPVTFITTLAVIFSGIWLETCLVFLEPNGVLLKGGELPEAFATVSPQDWYSNITLRHLSLVLIGYLLFSWFWKNAGRLQRILISIQWLLALVGLLVLPMLSGRLASGWMFPQVSRSKLEDKSIFLLLDQNKEFWMVWNRSQNHFEAWPKNGQNDLIVGPRVALFQ
jgi:hypothetical protein